jgi:hypothetical protein
MKHVWLSFFLAAFLSMAPCSAVARVIYVGPSAAIKTIAAASRLAQDDDLVMIAPGQYRGDVAVWTQKRLTIRGDGERPVLIADGKNAEGKAIWVFRDGDFKVSNIEFRDAQVPDHNGAGIRLESGKLHVSNCRFVDNESGILASGQPDIELDIVNSEFSHNGYGDGLTHNLYVGAIARLSVSGSYFHHALIGHLIKSRARVSDIRYSLLVDGVGGTASYEADFPNGGQVTMVGNVLGQSSTTENRVMVAYGSEGYIWPDNKLRMVHNTLYSEGLGPAWFLRVFENNQGTPPTVLTRNNLLAGYGPFTATVEGEHRGNYFVPTFVLGDPAIMDFSLGAGSWLRRLVAPIDPGVDGLRPRFEQLLPSLVTPIPALTRWAPGAIQTPSQY